MKEQTELARKVNENLKALGVTHRELTDRLGCGATLVSMFTNGGNYGASDMTLYVLKTLSDPDFLNEFVGLSARRRAQKAYVSIMDFVEVMSKKDISERIGVTISTINRWQNDRQMRDIWKLAGKPRLGVAALRILAVELVAEGKKSFREQEAEKPEVNETFKNELSKRLIALAKTIDELPMDILEGTEKWDTQLSMMESSIEEAVDDQKRSLREKLERLESLELGK